MYTANSNLDNIFVQSMISSPMVSNLIWGSLDISRSYFIAQYRGNDPVSELQGNELPQVA